MSGEQRAKPGFLETAARHPRSARPCTAYVPLARAEHLANNGPMYKFHELVTLVRDTLADPDFCFPYVADDFQGYCCTLQARYAVRNDGRRVEPGVGLIFLVFLTESMRVTEWGWEDEDRSRPGWPALHVGRLGKPLWMKEHS